MWFMNKRWRFMLKYSKLGLNNNFFELPILDPFKEK